MTTEEMQYGVHNAIGETIRWSFGVDAPRQKFFRRHILPQLHGKTVLDYGCGTGFYTKIYSEVARRVVGYDISAAQLMFAKELNPGPNYTTVLPNEKFDVV